MSPIRPFRLFLAVFFGVLLASLVLEGGAAAIGGLLLVPLVFLGKVVFFVMLFAFFGRVVAHKGGHWGHRRPRHQDRSESKPTNEDRFDEWHRMAHAREEVDRWTPEVDV